MLIVALAFSMLSASLTLFGVGLYVLYRESR